MLSYIEGHYSLFDKICAREYEDEALTILKDQVFQTGNAQAAIAIGWVLRFDDLLCVPRVGGLIWLILHEDHDSRYSSHLSTIEMYQDLRQYYWWDVL